jgi:tRNA threonylcarbamoyladenosine biosynthesis protein TsaB
MGEPLILAVETSSRIGSVALALGTRLILEVRFSSPLTHSAEIFPAVRGLLDRAGRTPAQIEQVYLSLGPGSFTGLRIAVTLAKTMHLANAVKIVAVDTLDVIAANVVWLMSDNPDSASDYPLLPAGCNRIGVILDAKRGQFFVAVYERKELLTSEHRVPISNSEIEIRKSKFQKTLPDSLMTISQFHDQFASREKPIWLLGDGLVYYKDRFQAEGVEFLDEAYWSPRAGKVHLLGWRMALNGQFSDPLSLTPNYLRKPDVTLRTL